MERHTMYVKKHYFNLTYRYKMKKAIIAAAAVAATFLFSGVAAAHSFHTQSYKNECFDEKFKVWYKSGSSYVYYGVVWGEDNLIDMVAANPTIEGFAREVSICDGHTIRQANYADGSF